MIATEFAKMVRRARTERRDMTNDGWERVDESGGNLWVYSAGRNPRWAPEPVYGAKRSKRKPRGQIISGRKR